METNEAPKKKMSRELLEEQVKVGMAELEKINKTIGQLQQTGERIIGVVNHTKHLLETVDFGDTETK